MLMTFEMLKSLNEQESILRILYCPFFDCLMETINLWIKIKGSINLFSRVPQPEKEVMVVQQAAPRPL